MSYTQTPASSETLKKWTEKRKLLGFAQKQIAGTKKSSHNFIICRLKPLPPLTTLLKMERAKIRKRKQSKTTENINYKKLQPKNITQSSPKRSKVKVELVYPTDKIKIQPKLPIEQPVPKRPKLKYKLEYPSDEIKTQHRLSN